MLKKDKNDAPKILDVTAGMQGELVFKDPLNLRISGKFEGKLHTKGELTIGDKAYVKADISGDIITVAGTIEGTIHAYTSLYFTTTAKFNGQIHTPLLEVEKGAMINGACTMGNTSLEHEGQNALMSIEEVAQYLEIEVSLVKSWAEKGKIPAIKKEGNWLFEKTKIEQWIVHQK